MALAGLNDRYVKPVLVIMLFAVLAWAVIGCEDYQQWSPPPPPEEKTVEETLPLAISTEDRAILVVYEHLLNRADSYRAKVYLADFYATCDNWSAESELLKDGARMWYIVVDMTCVETWEERPYWQQAGWFVLQDGRVVPSNRLRANALRIEADLQELSLKPEL